MSNMIVRVPQDCLGVARSSVFFHACCIKKYAKIVDGAEMRRGKRQYVHEGLPRLRHSTKFPEQLGTVESGVYILRLNGKPAFHYGQC